MNKINKYILGATTGIALSLGLASCQDHFDDYVPEAPVASLTRSMTILEFKQAFWSDDENYCKRIGYTVNEKGDTIDDGNQYIISGRVVSSDQAGNVYKYLIIQDETAALTIGVNRYNLYLPYRQGQEIVIDLKGMYCGRYSGLFQMGFPSFRESYGAYAPSFMAPEMFYRHIQLNGYPDISKIDTIQINEFSEIGTTTPETLQKYQSQLVKFNNVYFTNGGTEQFGAYHENVKQYFVDSNGDGSMYLYTSGYSDFWNQYLPTGNGDVCGILSWYNGWQVVLNSTNGCMNFGNPTLAPGSESNPYTVMDAIGLIEQNKTKTGWVKGYIVGAVAPEVTEVKSNADIEWDADVTLSNTLVIGATAETKDISQALIIALPQGSALRKYGNLVDNPSNYLKEIEVKGMLGSYMETYGILNNNGSVSEFKIEGVEIPDDTTTGDGTEASPYGVGQVVAMNPSSTTTAVASEVWVEGYIVGSIPSTASSVTLENAVFGTTDAAVSNLVLAPTADCKDCTQCITIQLVSGSDVRSALNLKDNPGKLGANVALKGDVMKYCGGPGLKNTSTYKIISEGEGGTDTPNPPTPGDETGNGTETSPYGIGQVIAMNPTSTTTAVASEVWVGGYIVGSIPTTASSVTLENAVFGTTDATVSNLVLAPTADCKDYSQCIAIQLVSGSDVRSALNLKDNPGKLGANVALKGDVMKYCGGPGLKNTSAYKLLGEGDNGNDNPNPDTPVTPPAGSDENGTGNEDSPYTVSQVIAKGANLNETGMWVIGYIVGSINGAAISGAEFGVNNPSNTNLLLAPTADCTDYNQCIPVQLPSGTIRTELSLQVNPTLLGKHIELKGDLIKYFNVPGLKNTSAYVLK